MKELRRLLKTYSPTRVLGALRRRRNDWLRKLQYRPQSVTKLRDAVLFESFQGKVIGDSSLDIYHELKSRRDDLEFIWTTSSTTKAPAGSRSVRHGSREWLQAIATSKYLVNNTNFPWYFRKVNGQVYLQTWHGTPLKRLGRDIDNHHLAKSYLETMDREAGFWDYLVSPSPFCTEIFPGAFNYRGQIIETGYPRNDRPSKTASEERQRIREKIGISDRNQTVVMYAPTWRDYNRSATGNWQSVNFMNQNVKLPEGFTMIYRGHTNNRRNFFFFFIGEISIFYLF